MADFSVIERAKRKIRFKMFPLLAKRRRSRLNNTDFSIISNNCWGGCVYEYFGIRKLSPTVGCYFFAEDYIKFLEKLEYYIQLPIVMIKASESKHYQSLCEKGEENVVVGRLDDIEVIFLHYKDPQEAQDKWRRRTKRVNWNNLIIKFGYQNEAIDDHVHRFVALPYAKKVLFVAKEFPYKEATVIPGGENNQIISDTFYFDKHIDIYALINS